jgi:dipeptidyl aminopeptidase/acylaminoacyl peptidase
VIEIGCSEAKECIHLIMRPLVTLNFEENCKAVVSHLSERTDIFSDKIISMGISLGAYWTMKLASVDRRVKFAVGISTPAIYHQQWKKLPRHYWSYFQQYFGTEDLRSTRVIAEQMTLAGVMEKIECPTLLIHGKKDKISHPDAMVIFSKLIKVPLTTRVYPNCGHGCFEAYEDILSFIVKWSRERLEEAVNV